MPRRSTSFLFVLGPALLLACSSGGSGSEGHSASGGLMAGDGGSPGAGGRWSTGGSSASGGTAAGGAGRSSTGGVATTGGTGASGAAGDQSSSGGVAASGGTSGGAVGGQSATGGVTASGGSGAGGGMSTGGASAGRGAGGASGGGTAGAMSGVGGAAGAAGTASGKCPDSTWKLAWSDEFDGPAGTAADGSKWTYDTGPNWYNGELQDYTSGTANASLDGSGNLVIEARKEAVQGRQYTSARLKTEGKKTFTYGRFESRMKLPYGQGMWPAFWLLGGNNWPNTGEIDIMENLGREPSIAHGTMHGPGYSGAAGPTASFTLPGGAAFSDDFHIFAIEWETNAIRWYVDDSLYSTKTPADIQGNTWVFDHGFFIILNLAIGGDWPGAPDDTTVFPQQMLIDYVHVCQK
jgi:beta-glucanase (GH16 family)